MSGNLTTSDLEEVWAKILSLDFTAQKRKMHLKKFLGWSTKKLDIIETQYKRILFLWYKYPNMTLPPSEDVDEFWHYHILDTKKYHKDCELVFGRYVHHYPYFGLVSKEENEELVSFFEDTLKLYEAEFHEELFDIEEVRQQPQRDKESVLAA